MPERTEAKFTMAAALKKNLSCILIKLNITRIIPYTRFNNQNYLDLTGIRS